MNLKNNKKTTIIYLIISKKDIYGNYSKIYSKDEIIYKFRIHETKDFVKFMDFVKNIKQNGFVINSPEGGCEIIEYNDLLIIKEVKTVNTEYTYYDQMD